jgi:hypothetical protein
MYYTTLAWPATSKAYRIERYVFAEQRYVVIDGAYGRPFLGYEYPEEEASLLLVHPMLGKDGDLKGRPYAFPLNDPPSLATIRWMARSALNDVEVEAGIDRKFPESPKWTDHELDGYIRECLGLFNTYLPRERTILARRDHASRRDLGLYPAETIRSVAFESHQRALQGQMVVMDRSSRRLSTRRQPMWDLTDQGELLLYFLEATAQRLEIVVTGPYALPHNDFVPLDIERQHWEILSIFAQGKSYLRLAGQSAQLDRWKETGLRTDNPISPVARRLLEEAMERITGMKGPIGMRRVRA